MKNARRVYWVELNRFDRKPDKSTWIEMSDAMCDHGYDVEILTGYGKARYQPAGRKVKVRYFRTLDTAGLFRIGLFASILVWMLFRVRRNDICILSPNALLMALPLRLTFRNNIHLDVRTVPVDVYGTKDKIDRWLFWKFPMWLCGRLVRGYSFITDRLRQAVTDEFRLNCPHHVIWQSGVNTSHFRPVASSNHSDRRHFLLFYHGTVTENRGIHLVVRALAQLPSSCRGYVRFVVVGEGSGLARLKEIAREQGVVGHVIFKGFVPYEQIPNEIAAADCCVSPLPDRPEWNVSSPLKIFEYMACGKPMILTPIPAHRDVLQDQDFIVWTAGDDVGDFVTAIARAFEAREELSRAGIKASERARLCYDWKVQGEKLAGYLKESFG